MKGSRFFKSLAFIIVILAAVLALIWYGKQLDPLSLSSGAVDVFFVSSLGLALAVIIPAVKRRWWSKPIDQRLVRQRLGAFYYVFWGVLILNFATYMATLVRATDVMRDMSAPLTELNHLFRAMSGVSLTLMFTCFILMIHFSRYIQDEGPAAGEDQQSAHGE